MALQTGAAAAAAVDELAQPLRAEALSAWLYEQQVSRVQGRQSGNSSTALLSLPRPHPGPAPLL